MERSDHEETATAPQGASRTAVILCVLVAISEGYDLQSAGVTAPQLKAAFAMTPEQLGWLFSVGTGGLLVGAAVGGRLSDRFGRKPALIASVLTFGLLSLLASWASNLTELLACRFAMGIGMGGTLPNLIAIAAEASSGDRRARAVGFVVAGLSIGGAVVSLTGMLDLGAESWRQVFRFGGAMPLLLAFLLLVVLPPNAGARTPARSQKVNSEPTAIIDILFARPRMAKTLFLWAASFLVLVSVYLLANWLPSLLVDRGLDQISALWVQIAFNIAGVTGGLVSGWILDRPNLRTKGIVLLYSAYFVSLFALANTASDLPLLLIAGSVVGAATTAVSAVLYALAPAVYPAPMRGTGVGMSVAVGRVGSIAGPLLAGVLLGSGFAAGDVLIAMLPLVALAAVAAAILSRLIAAPAEPGIAE